MGAHLRTQPAVNTVLIPCFRRPELLSECLRNILLAEGCDQYTYLFRVDHGFDPEVVRVINGFPLKKTVTFTPKTPYTITKQSYSLLTGLQLASVKSELVFLIEEDVLIGRDFFRWHEHVHAHNELFSSHANLNINTVHREGRWDQYYLTQDAYGSIGTCIPSKVIKDHINPHINAEYFRKTWPYIKSTFPDSSLGKSFIEQDGLIRRIQARTELPQAYPCTMEHEGLLYGPRCYHAGWYGKNRPGSIRGNKAEKTKKVSEIVYSQAAMREASKSEAYYRDSRPCALELPQWETLSKI